MSALKTVIGLLVFSLALDNSSDKESAIGGGANGSTSHWLTKWNRTLRIREGLGRLFRALP